MTYRLRATPYLFLAPALALLGIFVVYPIIAVVFYSLTDYDIVRPPVWVGLDNFENGDISVRFQMVGGGWDFSFGGFQKLLVATVDQFGNFAADQVSGVGEDLHGIVAVFLDGG